MQLLLGNCTDNLHIDKFVIGWGIMKTLYATIGSGNCYKAHLVMGQLGIAYNCEWVDVLKGETRSPDYLKINPAGTVPFLKLEDGRSIGESNAMLWYLAAGTHLFPQTLYDEAQALEWMIIEQTRLEPKISPARFFTTIVPEKRAVMAESIAKWQEEGHAGLARLDAHLANRDFVVGEVYSIADIALYGYVHVADEGGFDMDRYGHVQAWLRRVASTPGYRPMTEFLMAA